MATTTTHKIHNARGEFCFHVVIWHHSGGGYDITIQDCSNANSDDVAWETVRLLREHYGCDSKVVLND